MNGADFPVIKADKRIARNAASALNKSRRKVVFVHRSFGFSY